ncbi:MAG: FkbM family methyltransferase [Deferribacteres bacterium]|nr:FkbM family methyltransferase [candidate division KSB1 bacterium]MCB9501747.1 FkbM family methyltransferase [Deferribacteres bacterium]
MVGLNLVFKKIRKKIGTFLPFTKKIRDHYFEYRIFATPENLNLFKKMQTGKLDTSDPIPIKLSPSLSKYPLYCRPNTSDHTVLWTTFAKKYHLPIRKLGSSANILDLGVNIGSTILHLNHEYPDAFIVGVEMDKGNFEVAKLNTSVIKDSCDLLNKAVWCRDELVTYSGKNEESFAITGKSNDSISIEATTISRVIEQYGWNKVDYVKMDIEGAEMVIFENDLSWLNKVKQINLEIHDFGKIEFFINKLQSSGFKVRHHKTHWSGIYGFRL